MGFIKEAAAVSLALNMLGAPAAAESPKSTEAEAKYQLPMEILEEMVDVDSPAISSVYKRVMKNPAKHIEIVDRFGYGDHPYIEDGFSYFIYPDEQIEDEIDPPWSIAVFVEEFNGEPIGATVVLQMNSELEVYQGGEEDEVPDFSIPGQMLIKVSEEVFNEPTILSETPWEDVPNSNIPMIGRAYMDENIGYFEQIIRSDNLITYYSPFPVPSESNSEVNSNHTLPDLPTA